MITYRNQRKLESKSGSQRGLSLQSMGNGQYQHHHRRMDAPLNIFINPLPGK